MKAIVCAHYGPPSQLKLTEVSLPQIEKNQVLVKIKATAINDYDWSMVRGKPYLYRLLFGLRKPKTQSPGMELSGVIEAVGEAVTSFQVGDEVYGDISAYGFGSFAEYIAIHEKALVHKPSGMSFEEAAAIPHASMLAYQALVKKGQIRKGQKVLINGAGGGVGTFGLQIAKLYGVHVTGVDTGEKLNKMREMGFDAVLDYKKIDITKADETYDLIIDPKTIKAPWEYMNILKIGGSYVTVGGRLERIIQMLLWKPIAAMFSTKSLHLVALEANEGLDFLHELYEKGLIKAVIDGPYPLADAGRLIAYFGQGKHTGKIVLRVAE